MEGNDITTRAFWGIKEEKVEPTPLTAADYEQYLKYLRRIRLALVGIRDCPPIKVFKFPPSPPENLKDLYDKLQEIKSNKYKLCSPDQEEVYNKNVSEVMERLGVKQFCNTCGINVNLCECNGRESGYR